MNVDEATTPTRPRLLLTIGRLNLDRYVEQLGAAMPASRHEVTA